MLRLQQYLLHSDKYCYRYCYYHHHHSYTEEIHFELFILFFTCGREFLTFEHQPFLLILCICPLAIVSPCSPNNEFLFIALSVCCHYCRLLLLWKAVL